MISAVIREHFIGESILTRIWSEDEKDDGDE